MTRTESWLQPTSLDACDLADWAEAIILLEERQSLSRSAIRQRLNGGQDIDSDETDVSIDFLLAEVERRKAAGESTYPFVPTGEGISRDSMTDEGPYEFLLWLAVSPKFREQKRFQEADLLFDNLAKQALIRYLGPNARGVRFGFPASDGRPSGFREAVGWLAGLLGLETGSMSPRPELKDGGADVVVWNPFRDGRSGFVVILCQCTVRIDWTKKAADVVAGSWNGWIDFGLAPVTAIAIPFALPPAYAQWDELRRTVNIMLDRTRLVELIRVANVADLESIKTWNSKERSLLT